MILRFADVNVRRKPVLLACGAVMAWLGHGWRALRGRSISRAPRFLLRSGPQRSSELIKRHAAFVDVAIVDKGNEYDVFCLLREASELD